MIDEELITRGKALKRLKDNEDFSVLLAEWVSQINKHKGWALDIEDCPTLPPFIATQARHKYQALNDLLLWIDEEIESAGYEILKKQKQEQELEQ